MNRKKRHRETTLPAMLVFLAMGIAGGSLGFSQESSIEPGTEADLGAHDDLFATTIRPVLQKYCFECHSGDDAESEIDLEGFQHAGDVANDLETWSLVLDAIENGDMPPDDADELPDGNRNVIQGWILKSILNAKENLRPTGMIRRLNRVEYENTIRDLFRLSRDCFPNSARIIQTSDYFQPAIGEMPRYVLAVSFFFNSFQRHSDLAGVSTLPVDPPTEHGFANDQEALSISPLLMENYYEIANSMLHSPEFPTICGLWDSLFTSGDITDPVELRQRAHRQIRIFLPRVFRREIREEEFERYAALFDRELKESDDYQEAMITTISATLVSPNFLFRREFLSSGGTGEISQKSLMEQNHALASRLSYFLWGSMPDDILFQAAREKRLTRPDELVRQVERMMDDRRVKSLATDFGMQWLKVKKAASVAPDNRLYPAYYIKSDLPPPAISMMIEQLLLFETIMVENRSVVEFISADFGYLNRQLMDWYGLDPKATCGYTPPIEGFEDFFRVKFPNGHRGGIVTSGAMLISTSTTTRTSPVYRGSWILDVVFNSPPPAPPANVPPLEPAESGGHDQLNVRKKLEQHRLNPACASCHDRMDPLGFAMERFDAVGKWRKTYRTGEPIDTWGDLNGEPFEGAARFKNVIRRDKIRFVKAFVEHTMKYALGRKLHFSDEPEIRRMTDLVIEDDCRFRAVIRQVVLSEMFRRYED